MYTNLKYLIGTSKFIYRVLFLCRSLRDIEDNHNKINVNNAVLILLFSNSYQLNDVLISRW